MLNACRLIQNALKWLPLTHPFYMCLPLFKGPKVMGQTNNHKSNFHFLILGCKSFAVNYSLKSGTHRHHQTLGFIPGDALPGLYCNCLQFPLVLGAFSLQFCLQRVKCTLDLFVRVWNALMTGPGGSPASAEGGGKRRGNDGGVRAQGEDGEARIADPGCW